MNSSDPDSSLKLSRPLEAVVLLLVIVFGVLGNCLVAVTILSRKRLLKTNYYYLVFHLAVSDSTVLLCYFDEVCQLWEPNFSMTRSTILCKFWLPFQYFIVTSSPYFIVLIGILRYRVVIYPFKPAISRWKLNISISAVYIVALLYVTPYLLVLKYDPILGCIEDWPVQNMFTASVWVFHAFNYCIPVFLLTLLYSIICRRLIKQNNIIASLSIVSLQDNLRNTIINHRRNVKTFVVSLTVVVCYAVSALPVQIWWILFTVGKIRERPFQSNWAWMFFIYLIGTSALNPLIYGIIDNHFLTILKKCGKKRGVPIHVQ